MSAAEEGTPPASAALRAELEGMKLRALQKRAEELGVDQSQLDEAEDKAQVIDLILATLAAAAETHRTAALKEELAQLREQNKRQKT